MPVLRRPRRGDEFEVPLEANLMRVLQEKGVPVASSCLGDGVCAKCRLTILEGASNLSDPTAEEDFLRERENLPANVRISCQCRILGDVSVDAPYW